MEKEIWVSHSNFAAGIIVKNVSSPQSETSGIVFITSKMPKWKENVKVKIRKKDLKDPDGALLLQL